MKSIKKVIVFGGVWIVLSSCSKFGLDKVTYTVTPSPLEYKNDSVRVVIKATYPEKAMPAKGTATVTPILQYQGGEIALKPLNLKGEKATGQGSTVSAKGGTINYSDVIKYKPELKNSELHVKVAGLINGKEKLNDKTKEPIAYGVNTTPLLASFETGETIAAHNYGPVLKTHSTLIYFPYNSDEIRPIEIKSGDMDGFRGFSDRYTKEKATFKKLEIFGYASPEGTDELNLNLSAKRAKQMENLIRKELGKINPAAASDPKLYKGEAKGKDIAGFNSKLKEKTIEKKDDIRSIVAAGGTKSEIDAKLNKVSYTLMNEVEKELLAPLRRAELLTTVELRPKTNEELRQAATFNPSSLTLEEMHLTAQTILTDKNAIIEVYKAAQVKYPEDWRAYNNAGVVYVEMGKLDEAEDEFRKAEKVAPTEKVIKANLGSVFARKGDRIKAEQYFKEAQGTLEADQALAAYSILRGKYSEAASILGNACTFNNALANLLAGNPSKVEQILSCSKTSDQAISYYLRAIAAARQNEKEKILKNLLEVKKKDINLFKNSATDVEFIKFKNDSDFKSI